ncbi:MAG: 50S ribosomal protein L22 [Bacteroidales bacterium]|jgi:large subunit ribosomal protein L22|nr:50S ribosomal protein L22 [Bacteroidales bacterium]
MGSRKQERANQIKEGRKELYLAALRNNPTSPRKMRLVADMIRGMEVNKALDVLKFNPKEASRKLEKLLMSAIANWQAKNEGERIEESHLYVKDVYVDSGRILKRLRPAPQGRGHRINKRSNHVTIFLDSKKQVEKTDA